MDNEFVVFGGLWFDKVNGNTYNVAKILDLKKGDMYYTKYTYGYGHMYYHEAEQYIREDLGCPEFLLFDMGSSFFNKRQLLQNNF